MSGRDLIAAGAAFASFGLGTYAISHLVSYPDAMWTLAAAAAFLAAAVAVK